jgi:hypothetical protein
MANNTFQIVYYYANKSLTHAPILCRMNPVHALHPTLVKYRRIFEGFQCISAYLFIYSKFFAEPLTMFCWSVVGTHWFILSWMDDIILILTIGGIVIDIGKIKYFLKDLPNFHFTHHKSYTHWPGIVACWPTYLFYLSKVAKLLFQN